MKKRRFLTNSMAMLFGAGTLPSTGSLAATSGQREELVILTVTGAIDNTNRGKSDDVLDQLMHAHGVHFDRAFELTLSALLKLPAVSISPTMEYDGKIHQLTGPRLLDVLDLVGIKKANPTKIIFHGIDGYSPEFSFDLVKKYDFVVATHIDGKLLSMGGFGPLFALYDADRIPEIMQKPLAQRFSGCAWGLYCVVVA